MAHTKNDRPTSKNSATQQVVQAVGGFLIRYADAGYRLYRIGAQIEQVPILAAQGLATGSSAEHSQPRIGTEPVGGRTKFTQIARFLLLIAKASSWIGYAADLYDIGRRAIDLIKEVLDEVSI